ncbi:DUF2946 family protein [Truepera radiovictrix]|uniref:DUF2946 domain-containing protein n=1 Tax=Truepera radiovictrix (strain DSM 17093 / CIP 108686 / LMG 22925 / RQ-24) TaxID=649638 RepID=D7CUL9_TRURR|nr:DUF2946 family protein [Truepera radiovictrix]ADI14010.1 hypothetical protein Trad_0876 [Truepera radiovictrix DSM 17093]WMT57430.1 DUF2946 family protein [Truepera radiovictrix]
MRHRRVCNHNALRWVARAALALAVGLGVSLAPYAPHKVAAFGQLGHGATCAAHPHHPTPERSHGEHKSHHDRGEPHCALCVVGAGLLAPEVNPTVASLRRFRTARAATRAPSHRTVAHYRSRAPPRAA